MAWPGTLSAEEQTSLLAWTNGMVRPLAGELARLGVRLAAANTEYNGAQNNTNGNLSKLADADVIPVGGSGLQGAEPITKSDLVTLISYFQGVLVFNTEPHRQNLAAACGETNIIG